MTPGRPSNGATFAIDHLPFGAFASGEGSRLCARMGDKVVDLRMAAEAGLVPEECDAPNLDRLLAAPRSRWRVVTETVKELVFDDRHVPAVRPLLRDLERVRLVLPFTVGDFVDFYSSEAHATNVGRLFRPDAEPLLPNWKHLPVAYHGRAGTVVVSGTPVVRPNGQYKQPDGTIGFGPSRRLDIEIEMGWVVGGVTAQGHRLTIDDAEDRIFGLVVMNDWSARDIQAWEYAPLGPFLGKSFATSVSAWVTPLEAMEPYRVPTAVQDPEPLSYLRTDDDWGVQIELTASLTSARMRIEGIRAIELARVDYAEMYWSMAQQFAHLTVNGASARPGDLCGSGTISGWSEHAAGSLLERTRNGEEPLTLPDGSSRTFLEDGDMVTISAATPDGAVVLGDVTGEVVAA